ncbi:hypothetical protein HY488_03130 [Candidatus Woesearchaeota archaeon]|nr:hypothetical protein [Candidatus Woesearchaeota archaeon]
MATNLLLIECPDLPAAMEDPQYYDWGNLYLAAVTRMAFIDPPPYTTIYRGAQQSLSLLGMDQKVVNLLAFQFNSGDRDYYRKTQLVEDLRWLRETHKVDLATLRPIGWTRNTTYETERGRPRSPWAIETDANDTIDAKIREAQASLRE